MCSLLIDFLYGVFLFKKLSLLVAISLLGCLPLLLLSLRLLQSSIP